MTDHTYADQQMAAAARYDLLRARLRREELVRQVHDASAAVRALADRLRPNGKAGPCASVEFAHPVQNPVENDTAVIHPVEAHDRSYHRYGERCRCFPRPIL